MARAIIEPYDIGGRGRVDAAQTVKNAMKENFYALATVFGGGWGMGGKERLP